MTLQGQARKAVKQARENIEKRTTHTPGPWKVKFDKMGGYDCMSDAFKIKGQTPNEFDDVAVLDLAGREDEHEMIKANARLISAAPDLFNAVLDLLDCPDLNLDELEPQTAAAIGGARSAISKAKGE